jgi:hypothetical protein
VGRIGSIVFAAGVALIACLGVQARAAGLEAPAGGQIRALIVGIDNYANVRRLKGAVADARDLSEAFHKAGVGNVKLLIDQDAVRPAVLAELDRLVDQAQAKDLVFISFAGHGSQRPESVPHSKPDGLDEAYVLQRFDPGSSARNPDLIIGPEMKHYLAKLEAKDVDVIFIADTCHGGGLIRKPDPRAGELSYRTSAIGAAAQALLDVVSEPADALRDDTSFKRVTFLAAVDRFSKAPEVDIPGQPTKRGALSYAVARAIEGKLAWKDQLTRGSLFGYARQIVAQYARQKQTIVTEPISGAASLDVAVWRGEPPAMTSDSLVANSSRPFRVAVNGDVSALKGVNPKSTPFLIATDVADADLVWDPRTKEAIVAGDVVAEGVAAQDVPDVVDRVRAISEIAQLSERAPQTIALQPSDKLHHDKEVLTFEARDIQDKYAVIFNLSGAGEVQFLYPQPDRKDPAQIRSAAWRLPVKVGKPFGADTVIVVVSDQPLTTLATEIKGLDQQQAAAQAVQALRQSLLQTSATRVGFATIFTAP